MRYSQDIIDQLLDRLDMLELARGYVDGMENRAGRWWGSCPFHSEKTPSFTLNLERKSYYCFGCQEKGNAIGLLMKLEHCSFPEALQKLAKRIGFVLPQRAESEPQTQARKKRESLYRLYVQVHKSFRQNLRSERGQIARAYLEQREVCAEMVELFELGYAVEDSRALYQWLRRQNYSSELLRESGLFSQRKEDVCLFWQRLIFPIFDVQGRVIAFSGRELNQNVSTTSPKYINSRESVVYRKSESLFGLYQSLKRLRRERSLILCEGNLDVLAWYQAGIDNAAAPLGTAFTTEQAKLLKRYCDKVILAFDGDESGQEAIYKAAFLLEQEEISSQVIPLPAGRDPSDILQHEGAGDLKSLAQRPQGFFSFLAMDMEQRFALDELTGVSAALRFLSPFMRQVKVVLRRELYIAQFAKLFGLTQEVLAAEASWQYRSSQPAAKSIPSALPMSEAALAGSPNLTGLPKTLESPGSSARRRTNRKAQLTPALQADLVEREFWASLLLQADLYPEWQELLSQLPWESEDALLLKKFLDQANEELNFNFETLCDRVSRCSPSLGEWLLHKKLEPLQGGNVWDSEGYDIASYRRTILRQKYCGVQEFRIKQRKGKALKQIQVLELEGARTALQFELLKEIQGFDCKLVELRETMEQLQKEIQHSSKHHDFPILRGPL